MLKPGMVGHFFDTKCIENHYQMTVKSFDVKEGVCTLVMCTDTEIRDFVFSQDCIKQSDRIHVYGRGMVPSKRLSIVTNEFKIGFVL